MTLCHCALSGGARPWQSVKRIFFLLVALVATWGVPASSINAAGMAAAAAAATKTRRTKTVTVSSAVTPTANKERAAPDNPASSFWDHHAVVKNKLHPKGDHDERNDDGAFSSSIALPTDSNAATKSHDWEHLGLKQPTSTTDPHGRVRCQMPEPTADKIHHDNSVVQECLKNRRRRAQDGDGTLVIPTCVHVIRPDGDTDDTYLNAAMIQDQINGLNEGFSSESCCDPGISWCNNECSIETGIRFALALTDGGSGLAADGALADSATAPNACITRTFSDRWYFADVVTQIDTEMRQSLRRGGPDVLNIFFKGSESGLLGIAQFPSDYATQSNTDAVLVGDAFVIGGGDPSFGEGDTLTHEVGHWMGLFHTFRDGCGGGDLIGDTPAEKSPAYGCEVGRDTCRGREGLDPVHNFMDYSDDHCLYEFTEDQITRMMAQFTLYRSGLRQLVSLDDGITSVATDMIRYELQTYVLDVAPGTQVECESSAAPSGDVDMYMRDGQAPVISTRGFDCRSERASSAESCSIVSNTGQIYVSLYGFRNTDAVVVTCTGSGIEVPVELSNGSFSAPFDLRRNDEAVFTLPISDPNARVVCLLDSGEQIEETTSFSLRFDQPPDLNTDDYDCRAAGSEACSVVNPGSAMVLWALVASSAAINDISIACYVTIPDATIMLTQNVPTAPISLDPFALQIYSLSAPQGSVVTCMAITAGGGAGNMFLRWTSEPDLSTSTYDCSVFDLTRSCTVSEPGLATPTLFVAIEAMADGLSSLELDCTVGFSSIPLEDGVATEPFDLFSQGVAVYDLAVSRGDNITCTVTADDPDRDSVDLYLSFDAPAGIGIVDCYGVSFTGIEECTVSNAGASTVLYAVVQSFFPNATGIVLACDITSPQTGQVVDSIMLTDGVASDAFSLDELELELFTLEVEPGARTTCSIEGLDGDADLFLRYNEESDLDQGLYDCSSSQFFSFETCTLRDAGSGGVLFATVEAFEAFTDLTITCTSEFLGPPIILEDGVSSGPYSLLEDETVSLVLMVEPKERVVCITTGSGGDADLALRFGQEADIPNFFFDCLSNLADSEEICALPVPDGTSTLWIALYGFTAADEVSITCSRMDPLPIAPPISLTDGVASDPLSLDADSSQRYTYPVAPGTRVTCQLEPAGAPGAGDADLYLRFDEEPDILNFRYDCVSADTASQEACSLDVPEGVSTVWATTYAYSTFEDVIITCTSEDRVALIELFDGQPSDSLSLAQGLTQVFQLNSPSGSNVICETSLLVEDEFADADLYVRIDAEPDLNQALYDCFSLGSNSAEACVLSGLTPGTTLFVTILAFTAFSDLILTCSSYSGGSVAEPSQLSSGVASAAIQLNINQVQDFTFETNNDAICTLQGSTGDADLFLRWSDPPIIDGRFPQFDCSSEGLSSNESCAVQNPGESTALWARVLAFQAFSDVVITCTDTVIGDVPTTDPPVTDSPSTDSPIASPPSEEPTATPAPVGEGTQAPSTPPITDGTASPESGAKQKLGLCVFWLPGLLALMCLFR